MSFMKTLATLAVGFAAAKGFDKYRQAGGMSGMKDMMKSAGQPGGVADSLGAMAEKMGLPGAQAKTREMFGTMGSSAASSADAAQTGLNGLFAALTGATAAGGAAMAGMAHSAAEATGTAAVSEENAKLMIRAMILAARADGEIDADERARIMDHLTDASDAEIAFVEEQLMAPVDPVALAKDTDAALRGQVYAMSLMAIKLDTPAEQAYLDQLAKSLGLDAATRAMLDGAQGRTSV